MKNGWSLYKLDILSLSILRIIKREMIEILFRISKGKSRRHFSDDVSERREVTLNGMSVDSHSVQLFSLYFLEF